MTPNIATMNIPPYGQISVHGGQTLAYMNGDCPHLFLRIGSDAVKVPQGHSVPVEKDYAALINPYPRKVEVLIGRGLPVRYGSEPMSPDLGKQLNVVSYAAIHKDAAVGSGRFGVGIMAKRGKLLFEVRDRLSDTFGRIMIFPGAKPEFMSHKPVGCMEQPLNLAFSDGVMDTSLHTVSGNYTQAHFLAWITAAGYTGTPTEMRTHVQAQANSAFRATSDTAVFYLRDEDQAASSWLRITHLGADLEDFN